MSRPEGVGAEPVVDARGQAGTGHGLVRVVDGQDRREERAEGDEGEPAGGDPEGQAEALAGLGPDDLVGVEGVERLEDGGVAVGDLADLGGEVAAVAEHRGPVGVRPVHGVRRGRGHGGSWGRAPRTACRRRS